MTHGEAWTRLPDLLDDRDDPGLLAHLRGCAECQRQLFLLGRVDRALRAAAAGRRETLRGRRSRWLRFSSGLVAAAFAATVVALFLPHHAGLRQFTLRTAAGEPIGHAILNRSDAENTSLTLVARGLPARGGNGFVLWAAGRRGPQITIGRFMVGASGECRARFNLPAGHDWARFWVTRPGNLTGVVASTD